MRGDESLQLGWIDTDGAHPGGAWRASAWLVSVAIHLSLLVVVSMISIVTIEHRPLLTLVTPLEPVAEVVQEFAVAPEITEAPGAASSDGASMALGSAAAVDAMTVVPLTELPPADWGAIEFTNEMLDPTDRHQDPEVVVRGLTGEGVTGAEGAIDRIAHEILLSIEERPTLVIWLFDQSLSLSSQREQVVARFERVYDQLGVIEAQGNPAFRQDAQPLLTSVWAFGKEVHPLIVRPTNDVEAIKNVVRDIDVDDSGDERVFSTIYAAVSRFKKMRARNSRDEPDRNVMVVVFSDEVGDDQVGLDETVTLCRKLAVPVYVVGVPAPFGLRETQIKWVDLDPSYDQAAQWGIVNQGPESLAPERVVLPFAGNGDFNTPEYREPLDSGFGPFALTRLCAATGGIYFTVHPNRTATHYINSAEVANYSSDIRVFFDPEVMRRYRPDYVSAEEYGRLLDEHPVRRALVQAARISQIERLAEPVLQFIRRDEAGLVAQLTEAQKDAAKLQPQIDAVFELLLQVEPQRDQEFAPRWQAGYDLAMGTVAAVKVRTEGYNAQLAQAKRGMAFQTAENNTWILHGDQEVAGGSRLTSLAEKSRKYLQRVIADHPRTPWAFLAKRELDEPMGWRWGEAFTDLTPPRAMVSNNVPAPPQDEQRQMLQRKQLRPVPRL